MELQYEKDSKERIPYEHYLERFQKSDPKEISQRTGIPYNPEQRVFTLRLMGVTYQIRYPEYEVHHVAAISLSYPSGYEHHLYSCNTHNKADRSHHD